MHPEARLKELGLELPVAAKPVAAYVPAVRSGNLVFISGQGPWRSEPWTGKVGAEIGIAEAQAAARDACLFGLAALKDEIGDLANVTHVVRLCVYVASAPGFGEQPQVANGASTLLQEIFGDAGRHARAAVGVSELPFGIPVEIEFVFEVS